MGTFDYTTRTQVENIFSGINYLEKLSSTKTSELITALATKSGSDIHSGSTDSIFNKFAVFKYANFIKGTVYQPAGHFIGYEGSAKADPNDVTARLNDAAYARLRQEQTAYATASDVIAKNDSKGINNQSRQKRLAELIRNREDLISETKKEAAGYETRNKSKLANPTATNIINWASNDSMQSIVGFQPYAMSDFMFCKNYGKIPNNRLVTLRRYPMPIEDTLRSPGQPNMLPIAQAITWFGEGSENLLSNIGVMKTGLKWKTISVTTDQKIDGNEVLVTELAAAFKKIPKMEKFADQLVKTYVAVGGKDAQLQQLSGIEAKLQQFSKDLYESNGPYWNRIFGPVNVINETTQRDRGMQPGWNTPFTLKFHYSFRSFNGLSPKIVALDLISSFTNLTYNDAQFLGQLARYFPKPGVKFDRTTEQLIGDILTKFATSFEGGGFNDMMQLVEQTIGSLKSAAHNAMDAMKKGVGGDFTKIKDGAARLAQVEAITALSAAIPKLISAKSALSDRPVGEWHLVVGNPMNPIMVMGDMVCTGCQLKFDEEMGPDDFPTGCTFDVTLQQGKPRDKVSFERMFNLGTTKLLQNTLRDPSSASDTFGTVNNKAYESLAKELSKTDVDAIRSTAGGLTSFNQFRNRYRRSYKYAKETDSKDEVLTAEDSRLWLYYDRGQHKN